MNLWQEIMQMTVVGVEIKFVLLKFTLLWRDQFNERVN